MVRKTLYQRLENLGVSVAAEYDALIRLLKVEQNIFDFCFCSMRNCFYCGWLEKTNREELYYEGKKI